MLSKRLLKIEDVKKVDWTNYRLHDIFMAGFAVMFFQDPSLLAFQRRLEKGSNLSNLQTMFNVTSIPDDTQFREVLDRLPSHEVDAVFADYLYQLQRSKYLASYQFMDSYYLVPIDGSQYFSSKNLSCSGCLEKNNSRGETRYYHQILQAVIVHPAMKQVLPLAPEPIRNHDGTKKQDCEINAGKRILGRIRATHLKLKIIAMAGCTIIPDFTTTRSDQNLYHRVLTENC